MQHAATTISTALLIRRQTAARLGRAVVVLNAEKILYESVFGSGVFDRFGPLGIAAPDAAPTLASNGAGNVNGTRAYLVVYVYIDADGNEYMSNPFDPDNPAAFAATSNEVRVTFNDNPTHPLVTHRRIYRNDSDGGTSFGLLATVPLADAFYDDDDTDATVRGAIAAGNSVQLNNDVPESGKWHFAFSHKNYMFLLGDQTFIFGKPGNPFSFPLINETPVEDGQGGRLRLCTPVGDILVDLKDSTVYEHHFDSLPHGLIGDGFGKTMTVERGVVNESTLANVRGTQYVQDRWGIYQSRGGTEENHMSLALDGLWPRLNWEQVDKFCAVHDDNAAYFFVAQDGEDEARCAFVLNLQSIRAGGPPKWHLHRYPTGIRHACRFRMAGDTPKTFGMHWATTAAFMTPLGYVGYLSAGYRDMVNPALTGNGSVTTEGNTTSFVDAGASTLFSTTNEAGDTVNVLGAPLRFLLPWGDAWEREFIVTGISGSTITYAPATSLAVPEGTAYVIGGIDGYVTTPLMDAGDANRPKTLKEAVIEYQPGGISQSIEYGARYDRKRNRITGRAWSESDRAFAANSYVGEIEIGSGQGEGGLGVKSLGMPAEACRYFQLVLGFSGVDVAMIVDALTVKLAGDD